MSKFFCCALGLLLCFGCNSNTDHTDPVVPGVPTQAVADPLVENLIKATTKAGVFEALQLWAKSKPDSAKEAATILGGNINSVLLPYLNGGNLPGASEVQAFFNASLLKNIPPDITNAIMGASTILDIYAPVPGVPSNFSPDKIAYLKDFLIGVQGACDQFTQKGVEKHWVH